VEDCGSTPAEWRVLIPSRLERGRHGDGLEIIVDFTVELAASPDVSPSRLNSDLLPLSFIFPYIYLPLLINQALPVVIIGAFVVCLFRLDTLVQHLLYPRRSFARH